VDYFHVQIVHKHDNELTNILPRILDKILKRKEKLKSYCRDLNSETFVTIFSFTLPSWKNLDQ
jgi:hypothetical protein